MHWVQIDRCLSQYKINCICGPQTIAVHIHWIWNITRVCYSSFLHQFSVVANLYRWSDTIATIYTLRCAPVSLHMNVRGTIDDEDECVWKILNWITHIWWWCYHNQPRLKYRFNQYQHNALSLRYIAQPFAGSEKFPNVIIIKWWMFYRAKRVCECDLLPGAIIISTTHQRSTTNMFSDAHWAHTNQSRRALPRARINFRVPSTPYHQQKR